FLTVLLNIARGLVALGLILTVLLLAFSPFISGLYEVDASWLVVGTRMTIPVSLTLDDQLHRVAAPSLGVEDVQLRNLRGSLSFPVRKGAFYFGNIVLLAAVFGVTLWLLRLLGAVLRTLRDGQPFVPDNAARIRWIGGAVLLGELARSTLVYFENSYAAA